MAEEIARLGIEVTSDDVLRAIRRLDKLENQSKKNVKRNKKLRASFKKLGAVIAAIGIVKLTKSLVGQINTYSNLSNRLKLVTKDAKNLVDVQGLLFDLAQETRVPLEGTVDLYTRLARSTKQLNLNQNDLASITETVNKTLIISGASAAEAGGALLQLGQGLAANALRGQELNSILEQTPRLAQAIAEGMGVQVGELKKLGEQGLITSEVVVKALQNQAQTVSEEFGRMDKTIGQAFTQIENTFLKTFGSVKGGGLIQSLDEFRAIISDPNVSSGLTRLAQGLIDVTSILVKAIAKLGIFSKMTEDLLINGIPDSTKAALLLIPGGSAIVTLLGLTKLDEVQSAFDLINTRISDTAQKIIEQENIINSTRGASIERIKEAEKQLRLLNIQQEKNLLLKQALTPTASSVGSAVGSLLPIFDPTAKKGGGRGSPIADVGGQKGDAESETALEKLRLRYATELQLLDEKEQSEIDLLNERLAQKRLSLGEHEQLTTDITKDFADKRQKISDAESDQRKAKLEGFFNGAVAIMNSGSKELFEIGKVAALATGALSLSESISTSYAAGSKLGGPLLGAAFAATAGIAQAANLAKIAGTSFGSKSSAPSSTSTSVPSAPIAQQPPQLPVDQIQTRKINVVVEGNDPHSDSIRKLIMDIQETGKDMGSDFELVLS